jgi:hypothetical protein
MNEEESQQWMEAEKSLHERFEDTDPFAHLAVAIAYSTGATDPRDLNRIANAVDGIIGLLGALGGMADTKTPQIPPGDVLPSGDSAVIGTNAPPVLNASGSQVQTGTPPLEGSTIQPGNTGQAETNNSPQATEPLNNGDATPAPPKSTEAPPDATNLWRLERIQAAEAGANQAMANGKVQYINPMGTAGENVRMTYLQQQGFNATNLNSLRPNAPGLDLATQAGFEQVKVSASSTYGRNALSDLTNPAYSEKAADMVIALRLALIKQGSWPLTLSETASKEDIAKFVRASATVAVPDDIVESTRTAVRTNALQLPENYGIPDGLSPAQLRMQVDQLAQRIQPIGLTLPEIAGKIPGWLNSRRSPMH